MADQKISLLNELTSPLSGDMLPIVNNGETKKITVSNLLSLLLNVSGSLDFTNDTAAEAGGVPLGGLYRNGNFVMIRIS
jgi:hypothetical protein